MSIFINSDSVTQYKLSSHDELIGRDFKLNEQFGINVSPYVAISRDDFVPIANVESCKTLDAKNQIS